MESTILAWLAAHRFQPMTAVMLFVTAIGRGGLVWVAVAWWHARHHPHLRMAAWRVVLAVLLAWLVADVTLKPLFHRERPFRASTTLTVVGPPPRDHSMPSGHAATAAAGAFALAAMWPQARAAAWTLAALVAVSRLYLGVHYPTDVLAGFIIGLLIAWLVVGRVGIRRLRPSA